MVKFTKLLRSLLGNRKEGYVLFVETYSPSLSRFSEIEVATFDPVKGLIEMEEVYLQLFMLCNTFCKFPNIAGGSGELAKKLIAFLDLPPGNVIEPFLPGTHYYPRHVRVEYRPARGDIVHLNASPTPQEYDLLHKFHALIAKEQT